MKLNKCTVVNNFVEQEIEVDVRYIKETEGLKIIVDSIAPLFNMSQKWLNKYVEKINGDLQNVPNTSSEKIKQLEPWTTVICAIYAQ